MLMVCRLSFAQDRVKLLVPGQPAGTQSVAPSLLSAYDLRMARASLALEIASSLGPS